MSMDSLRKARPTHQLDEPLLNDAYEALGRVEEIAGGGVALEGAWRHVGGDIEAVLGSQRLVEPRLQPFQLAAGVLQHRLHLRGVVVVIQAGV